MKDEVIQLDVGNDEVIYSSFGFDTFILLRNGAFFSAILNILIQVFVGLAMVWLGYTLTRFISLS